MRKMIVALLLLCSAVPAQAQEYWLLSVVCKTLEQAKQFVDAVEKRGFYEGQRYYHRLYTAKFCWRGAITHKDKVRYVVTYPEVEFGPGEIHKVVIAEVVMRQTTLFGTIDWFLRYERKL